MSTYYKIPLGDLLNTFLFIKISGKASMDVDVSEICS